MPAPSGLYVDIVHSTTPNGELQPGQYFEWYNSGANPSCAVSNVGGWCAQSSYGPIAAGQSVQGSVLSGCANGMYSYACPCCLIGSPRVSVHKGTGGQ